MRYMGSKRRYAKELLPIMLKDRKSGQYYVEPFVGGFNILCQADGNRIANDNNYYLIELFKALQSGWIPPEYITEEEYYLVKDSKNEYEPYYVGFVGFGCSYGGRWFEGYARGGTNKAGDDRNYCGESKRALLKQAKNLTDVVIYNKEYWEVDIPKDSIVYCDPPYAGAKSYGKFDHNKFWDWARYISREHIVYISEYSAPNDFKSIWEKKVNNTLVKDTGSKQGTERLFINEV